VRDTSENHIQSMKNAGAIVGFAVSVVLLSAAMYWNSLARVNRFDVNYGSSLLAVTQTTEAILQYHQSNGAFPFMVGCPTNLVEYGLAETALPLVETLQTNNSLGGYNSNIICVIARRFTKGYDGYRWRYVGTLSGRVFLIPAGAAALGNEYDGKGIEY
jgi:hypothetical protein